MLTGTLNSIREENAKLARDVEYIREMAEEDEMEDRLLDLEMQYVKRTENPYMESAESVNQISPEDNFSKQEVERILSSDHDLTVDEMLGI